MGKGAELMSFPYTARPLLAARNVFESVFAKNHGDLSKHQATLKDAGWAECEPIPLKRLASRLNLNRFGQNVRGAATKPGFKTVKSFIKRKGLFADLPHHDVLPGKWNEAPQHKNLGFRHSLLPDCYLSVVAPKDNLKSKPITCLWAVTIFQARAALVKGTEFVDPYQYAKHFNGTESDFFTPGGNRRDWISHSWRCENSGRLVEGVRRHSGRDGILLFFSKSPFHSALLPSSKFPTGSTVYTLAQSERLV